MKAVQKNKKDLTALEVAEILGVSTRFVLKLIVEKKLEAYRPGLRVFRITEEALARYKATRALAWANER